MVNKNKKKTSKRVIVVFPNELVSKLEAYLETIPTATLSNVIRVAVENYIDNE